MNYWVSWRSLKSAKEGLVEMKFVRERHLLGRFRGVGPFSQDPLHHSNGLRGKHPEIQIIQCWGFRVGISYLSWKAEGIL